MSNCLPQNLSCSAGMSGSPGSSSGSAGINIVAPANGKLTAKLIPGVSHTSPSDGFTSYSTGSISCNSAKSTVNNSNRQATIAIYEGMNVSISLTNNDIDRAYMTSYLELTWDFN